jgi:hypothetical protein
VQVRSFRAYATGFELHPKSGIAFEHLTRLFSRLTRVEFELRVANVAVNQGQMASDFDSKLERTLHDLGAAPYSFRTPPEIPQEHDFAFTFDSRSVVMEIEKSNREKILRDILKCHMYLHSGADFAVVALPRNYPHTMGVWNLFDFGVQRFNECQAYGFGRPELLARILLLGYDQFDAGTSGLLSRQTRQRMRVEASGPGGPIG